MPFSETYHLFKDYSTPVLREKHVRRFDREFWRPTGCTRAMSVLEIGCGTGHFLAYLQAKGVGDFLGIDSDPKLGAALPAAVKDRFRAIDAFDFFDTADGRRSYDRVVLFDVLEHFSVEDGLRLLKKVRHVLPPGGQVVIKVPNAASPWGLQFQFGDLTHKAAYSPGSLRQLAIASGMSCVRCYPHSLGSPARRFLDRALHGVLGRVLMSAPEIWSPNFFALLERPESGSG